MTEQDESVIHRRMDQSAAGFTGQERRRSKRYRYRLGDGMVVAITHPGGSIGYFQVKPRDISAGGISFLHGGYVYADSLIRLVLLTLEGKPTIVIGKAVRCRHIDGRVHEVGVAFERPLSLEQYIGDYDNSDAADEAINADVPALAGCVLCVCDEQNDEQLLRFHLGYQQGIEVVTARSGAEGSGEVGRHAFDAVLIDTNLSPTASTELIESIHGAGYTGPIIVLTPNNDPQAHEQLKSSGANSVLVKPYTCEQLVRLLSYLLPKPSDSSPPSSELRRASPD